jgi:type 1 glutamine amidotransferase
MKKMKKVILVTDGVFHPPIFGRMILRQTLRKLDGFTFRQVRTMEKLPGDMGNIDAVVVYVHHKRISSNALAKLENFVSSGGGLLGIHSATASFMDTLSYFKILGGRFIGHGELEPFDVIPVAEEKEPFKGIGKFTVKDELYIHDLETDVQPHFSATHEGEDILVVWTYHYGKGRVCYAVPGHLTETMRNPTYQMILQRGLAWVSQG